MVKTQNINQLFLKGLFIFVFVNTNVFSQVQGCPGVEVSADATLDYSISDSVNLSASYLEIGETTSYTVSSILYDPPSSYSGLDNSVSVGVDDVWSPSVNLPFNFCFYGNMYTECVISSNGAISFDTLSNIPSGYSGWKVNNEVPSSNLFLNSIFGVYHDLDPSSGGSVSYELIDEAPCRKLIVSYHEVPLYLCSNSTSTFQVVLYETTNIIDIYIEEKSSCVYWNFGNSVLGIQNASGSEGVSAPNRNTSNWVVLPSNPEAWRFTPSGNEITSIQWFDSLVGGNVVGTTKDITVSPSLSTNYRAEVIYSLCDGSEVLKSDNLSVTVANGPLTVDFDGVDDFVSTNSLVLPEENVTMMAWVNLDDSFTGEAHIMGESNYRVIIKKNGSISVFIQTNLGSYSVNSLSTKLDYKWNHVASTFDGRDLNLFINGILVNSLVINAASLSASTTPFYIGKDPRTGRGIFDGAIQEVKFFNKSLSVNQLREQIFQPIKNSSGYVSGSITNKKLSGGVLWDDLKLYLKLTQAITSITPDASSTGNTCVLHNMTTSQIMTAPLPYTADTSGSWSSIETWKGGEDLNIDKMSSYEWAIIQITNQSKITTDQSHNHLGLLLDAGTELLIENNQLLENTSYLKINGKLDLVGESQLIQGENSILDVSSSGSVERDQKGASSKYHYNYWSSPVSTINGVSNNVEFNISSILKDGTTPKSPLAINFDTSGYDGALMTPIIIADYWINTCVNMPGIYDWSQVRSSGNIKVGEGYTMKGTGTTLASQNYVFSGKPNNGLISNNIDGLNVYLVGNPYLSAIDASVFIEDNIIGNSSINGALYFWEHRLGNSHVLSDYEGGYATYNLLGGVKSISLPIEGNNIVKRPGRYIPVAQGFFVKGDEDGGIINFNNSQRIFKKENTTNSRFLKNSNHESSSENEVNRVYLNFRTPEGAERELLLGIESGLTQNLEKGYDAERIKENLSDCAWLIEDKAYVIQGLGSITSNLELPLVVKIGTSGESYFSITDFNGIPSGVEVFLKDNELNQKIKFEESKEISLNLETGRYKNRFFIVFESTVLAINKIEEDNETLDVYYNSSSQSLILKSNNVFSIENLIIYNILGQKTYDSIQIEKETNLMNLPVNLSNGTYIVSFTYNGVKTSKKIIVNNL